MITAQQIRGARGMLRWSAGKLSEMSGISVPTIQRMESAAGVPKGTVTSLQAIIQAFEVAGIEFIEPNGGGPGVRLKNPSPD